MAGLYAEPRCWPDEPFAVGYGKDDAVRGRAEGGDSTAGVGTGGTTSDGLSAVYENTKPKSAAWQPLPPVRSLPAVAHLTYSPERPKSFCQVSVGVSDNHTVDVSITLGQAKVGKVARVRPVPTRRGSWPCSTQCTVG